MAIHHRRPAITALVLSWGVSFSLLTGCGGSSKDSADEPGGQAAPPVAVGGSGTSAAGKSPKRTSTKSLRGKVIVIDPGHNGGNSSHSREIAKQVDVGNGRKECDTSGAETKAGYPEHAFTWSVSTKLKKLLTARGAKVVLTRANDTGVGPCITERAAIGNRNHADAALSVHADGHAASGHGFHIIEPAPVPGFNEKIVAPSKRLGRAIRDAYHEGTGVPYSNYIGTDALDERDDLGGLNLSKVPKVFIECGNLGNPGDATHLSTDSFRQRIAESLADGLAAYFS